MGKRLRSSLEIAMERFKHLTDEPPLTDEQKAKIRELQRKHDAKVAEKRIVAEEAIATAEARGEFQRAAELRTSLAQEIRGLEEKLEREKEKVRKGEA